MDKPVHSHTVAPFRRCAPGQLALLAAGLIPVLVALSWLLRMAHNGLDLTDEGFYLNNISDPWLYGRTVTQFGFIYHALFEALGQDVVRLRQAGMLISYGLALSVTWLLLRALPPTNAWHGFSKPLMAALIAVSAWLNLILTDGWMPTLSYNSLAFQGFLITVAATLAITRKGKASHAASWVLMGFGGWLCFMAKPSSAAALGACVLAFLWVEKAIHWRGLGLAIASAVVLLLLSGIVTDDSALGLVHRFRAGVEDMQVLWGERRKALFRLDEIWWSLPLVASVLGTSLALMLSTWLGLTARRLGIWLFYASQLLLLLLAMLIALGVYQPSIRHFRFHGLVFLAVPLGIMLGRFAHWMRKSDRGGPWPEARTALFFLVLPVAYAFGSGNNYWMTAIGAGFFWVLAGVALLLPNRPNLSWTALGSLACMTFALSVLALHLSMTRPYRQLVPLDRNTVAINLPNGSQPLVVSEPLASYVSALKTQSAAAGLMPGVPMLDLTGHRPTLPYLLGARAIALPWLLGGYPGSLAMAQNALDHTACHELAHAWLLIELAGPRMINPAVLQRYGLDQERDYTEAARASLRHSYGSANRRKEGVVTVLLKPTLKNPATLKHCVP
ncbi:MAG TPA: hypothetical protein DCY64_05815 [Hydrogenophaga sp.]|uniref:hypothetical protein n=1 Tax=Hydrogenophaga sp. TaxID=1904254 RepID=UPI0008BFC515|nr:hypothetical protein [Hydrogenophaga sp.]OGA76570.1 MAG: hypothetical protein A2X73_19915 [Burkholderiales bacterium GWE1_65_30]OGA91486.1 MAG: hypothetical protein A2X72_04820 [Burkholderiales bacterium GWF1_66_17]HAX19783.1 hypothetical protein [Hydrogenophaga sp.]